MRRIITVFDLDDTLYPELDYARSGFAHVSRWFEALTGKEGLEEQCLALLSAGHRHDIFNRALDIMGESHAHIPELVEIYRTHPPTLTLEPESRRALERARALGKVGVITDGRAKGQRAKLESLGVADLIDTIVVSDELGREHWKPSPLPYETIEERLGAPSRYELCYIGDNPTKDFITARSRGWYTIQLEREDRMYAHEAPSQAHLAHARIHRLEELFMLWPREPDSG